MDRDLETNYENLRQDREWSHETLAGHLSSLGAHDEAAHFRAMAAQDEAQTPTPANAPKARRAPKTEKA